MTPRISLYLLAPVYPLLRKLSNPEGICDSLYLEQAISDFIAYYNQEAKPIKWSYTVEKLERKLGTHS